MKKSIVNLSICLLHILGVVLITGDLLGTVVFSHLYNNQTKTILAICALGGLLAHYFLMAFLSKRKMLGYRTPLVLLCFDGIIACYMLFALVAVLGIDGFFNALGSMVYVTVINIFVVLTDILVCIHTKQSG